MKHGIPIRVSLGVLVLATVLPFVTLIAYNAYSQAQLEVEQAGEDALRAARSTAMEVEATLRRTRELLSYLSEQPAVRAFEPERCNLVFKSFSALFPEYTNLVTVRRDGERVCSAAQLPPGAPAKVDPQLFLAETVRSRAFTIGRMIRGVFSDRWILAVAHPVMDERGEIRGVVSLPIDLAKLRLVPRPAELPPHAVARIVDDKGTVIGSSVAPEEWIGRNFKDVPWFRLLEPGRAAIVRADDVDGIERIYGTVPIEGTTWHAAVGIPVDVVYGPVRDRLMLNAAVSLVALLLATALGYLIARRIGRPVEAIATAAREATQSSSVRELTEVTASFAPREIQALASDFHAMLKARSDADAGLRRAQAMAQLAHVVTQADGSFASWSETLPELIGRKPAAVPKDTREWLELLHPDDREAFRAASIEAARKGTRAFVEYRLRRADGAWIDVRQVMEPLPGPRGEDGARWFNSIQNVSSQKRAAAALQRFRLALDNSADMVLIIDRATMRHVDVNETACRLLGYTRDELLRMGPEHTLPVPRADLERAYDRFIEERSQPSGMRSYYLCKDGSHLPFEATRHVFRSGEAWLVAVISRDIRERIASEEALRRSEEGLKRLNRVYAVLSGINSLIVRVRDRQTLFDEVCRLAIKSGKFVAAWVGEAEREAGKIRMVASDGMDPEYAGRMPLELDKRADGYSLAGEAVTEGRAVIVEDMGTDPRVRLREEAKKRGYHGLAMLPLVVSGEAAGVLALYASEVAFFDEDEMRLLLELAGDISFALEHIKKTEQVEYLAYYDALTGIANRTLFHERLEQAIGDAAREGHRLAVIVHDIERFKTINDTLGRQAGDELLRQVAQRFSQVARDARWLGRLGADHFAVWVPDVTTEEELVRRTEERLAGIFAAPFRIGEVELRSSARLGIAVYPGDGSDADSLLGNAEAALKKAKETGEQMLFYTQEMSERVAGRLALENNLRLALERGEFVLHYQPKVDLATRRIVGVEALIRWQSPELGLVPPMRFIPLLEETGLILAVGSWALKRAALDHRAWVDARLKAPRVAVNVSPIQLRQRDFVGMVEEAILEGVAPTGIDLEITESLIMQDVEATIEKLSNVRKLGVGIAIDDFGTGYSSLSYLARLPVGTLKIDRSFIVAMLDNANTATLVETIISLARSLRLQVVAEGVETEEQARMLSRLHCDQMQGYLYSKPLPLPDITALLQKRS